ncbi:hypothetical protein ACN9MY_20055 [Pseudoduganella sp. R-31]|uniref:hypothetical protein n=1 Tax=Pseudoduganella sp. R-31 TaxID=3404060 RepID=UPI003CED828B
MNELPEPIRSVLRDYCHVEWFEVDELADDVKDGSKKFDIVELKKQFESLLSSQDDVTRLVNSLTFNEFESLEEVHAWLNDIYRVVFVSCPNDQ